MWKVIFFSMIFCIFCLLPNYAFSQEAPFGLHWGQTVSEVKELGVVLSKDRTQYNITGYNTNSLPANVSFAESYFLMFHNSYNLQKIVTIGKDITSDSYGLKGKEQYESIKNALAEKYGIPIESYEYVGGALFKEPDEFYQCLDYDGCGAWISFFEDKSSGMNITLELNGIRRGEGYILLTYEGPAWSKGLQENKQQNQLQDKEAL